MNRFRSLLIVAALGGLAIAPAAAQKTDPAQTMLEAAKQKETLEGDLASAIKQYQGIVDKYSKTNRGVAAQALVRMAECYQKLGDTQARKIFERITREFADQPDAVAVARARLGESAAAGGNAGMISLQRWTGPTVDPEGTISPDGRYLSSVDWDTGDLSLHDLATGADRRLTRKGTWAESNDFALQSAISRDGMSVAYSWYIASARRYELRMVKLDTLSPAIPAFRTLLDDGSVEWIAPQDWSPDGRLLAVQLRRRDHTTQIGLLSVSDGALRILKSLDSRETTTMFFSPDGLLVAYDLPVGDATQQRDVFVMNLDGTREVAAVVHPAFDTLMGWTPDGRGLLFASDRSGSLALWSQPMASGNPAGTPILVKSDLGPKAFSLGLTRAGGLAYGTRISQPNVRIAEVDFETGRVTSPPVPIAETYFYGDLHPDWSWDGKSLVYVSERANNARTLSIRSWETGQVREVPLALLSYPWRPRWVPDGSLTVYGTDLQGRPGIFRVDSRSGDLSPIVVGAPGTTWDDVSWSADGTRLVYRRTDLNATIAVSREMPAGQERELLRVKSLRNVTVSPNGQQVAYIEYDQSTKTGTLQVMPAQGGAARALARATDPASLVVTVEWTPDSRRVVFGRMDGGSNGDTTYWIIPAAGGAPVKLELDLKSSSNSLRIHPDGRHVAFDDGNHAWEVWTLEHFLPIAAGVKR